MAKKILRTELVLLTGVLASLALGRCSPVAPSFYKVPRGGGEPLPAPTVPSQDSSTVTAIKTQAPTYHPKFVEDSEASRWDGDEKAASTVLINEAHNTNLFSAFKNGKAISFPSNGLPSNYCYAYFAIDTSGNGIATSDIETFDTILVQSSGRWTLRVAPSVPADVAERVLDRVTAVRLDFKTMPVPAASPSPSPSAVPSFNATL